MENQHRKISWYRELSAEDIDLMNRVKAAGQALLDLQQEVCAKLTQDQCTKITKANQAGEEESYEAKECSRFHDAEPFRWAAIAKTDIQTGVMALVRSIAQPAGI